MDYEDLPEDVEREGPPGFNAIEGTFEELGVHERKSEWEAYLIDNPDEDAAAIRLAQGTEPPRPLGSLTRPQLQDQLDSIYQRAPFTADQLAEPPEGVDPAAWNGLSNEAKIRRLANHERNQLKVDNFNSEQTLGRGYFEAHNRVRADQRAAAQAPEAGISCCKILGYSGAFVVGLAVLGSLVALAIAAYKKTWLFKESIIKTLTAVRRTDQSVVVNWEFDEEHKEEIASITVTLFDASGEQLAQKLNLAANETSHIFTDPVVATAATVNVSPINSEGNVLKPASASVTEATATAPTPPTTVQVTQAGSTFTVAWVQPSTGAPSSYDVEIFDANTPSKLVDSRLGLNKPSAMPSISLKPFRANNSANLLVKVSAHSMPADTPVTEGAAITVPVDTPKAPIGVKATLFAPKKLVPSANNPIPSIYVEWDEAIAGGPVTDYRVEIKDKNAAAGTVPPESFNINTGAMLHANFTEDIDASGQYDVIVSASNFGHTTTIGTELVPIPVEALAVQPTISSDVDWSMNPDLNTEPFKDAAGQLRNLQNQTDETTFWSTVIKVITPQNNKPPLTFEEQYSLTNFLLMIVTKPDDMSIESARLNDNGNERELLKRSADQLRAACNPPFPSTPPLTPYTDIVQLWTKASQLKNVNNPMLENIARFEIYALKIVIADYLGEEIDYPGKVETASV